MPIVIHSKLIYNFLGGGGGGGAPKGTPYNGLYGKSLPERGTFVRSQTYEREGKSVISFFTMTYKGYRGIVRL